jgi:hypothetical protein
VRRPRRQRASARVGRCGSLRTINVTLAHWRHANRSPLGPPCPEHPLQGARSARANRIAADLAPIIVELQAAGMTSLNGIAAALEERGVPMPGGTRSLARGAGLAAIEAACGASPVGAKHSKQLSRSYSLLMAAAFAVASPMRLATPAGPTSSGADRHYAPRRRRAVSRPGRGATDRPQRRAAAGIRRITSGPSTALSAGLTTSATGETAVSFPDGAKCTLPAFRAINKRRDSVPRRSLTSLCICLNRLSNKRCWLDISIRMRKITKPAVASARLGARLSSVFSIAGQAPFSPSF